MIPTLEYLARNVVFENNLRDMRSKIKNFYLIWDEPKNLDQLQKVAVKTRLAKTERLGLSILLIVR